jgi:hypothetical protein
MSIINLDNIINEIADSLSRMTGERVANYYTEITGFPLRYIGTDLWETNLEDYPRHVCGLQGFDPYTDDCPACREMHERWDQEKIMRERY